MNWVQINIQVNEDFRYMKIHIFALRWKDEIRRSSQLRTLLKRVVAMDVYLDPMDGPMDVYLDPIH